MIKKFSKNTIEELQYYVYVYSDPDTNIPFYIGKGKGNRVFSHLSDTQEGEKLEKIKEIKSKGKEPKIDILVHGVSENTAKKIEAATIDLLGKENLTNKVRGYQSLEYGRADVNLIEAKYSQKDELKNEDIKENLIMFKISNSYKYGMKANEIYDITRSAWKINMEQAKDFKVALAIYDNVVLEVYEIIQWFKGGRTTFNSVFKDEFKNDDRYEFVGRIANREIRDRYINKSVKKLYNGSSHEFRYFKKYVSKNEKENQK